MDALWDQVLFQPMDIQLGEIDDYLQIISNHRAKRIRLAEAQKRKAAADESWVRGKTARVPQAQEDALDSARNLANVNLANVEADIEAAVSDLKNYVGIGIRKRLGIAAEHLYVLKEAFRLKEEVAIVDGVDGLVVALTGVLGQVRLYVLPDDEGDTTSLLELLTTATSLRHSIEAVKYAQSDLVKAEKDLITFPEADKRELFHHVPQTQYTSVCSYGNPMAGVYASW